MVIFSEFSIIIVINNFIIINFMIFRWGGKGSFEGI